MDFGTNIDDAGLVQFAQRAFADVGNVGGDFLRPKLGVAGDAGEFFDVNAGVAIFLHDAFGDQDGIFKVVAIPRHERHEHVLAQR